jgi:hypothetical protein
MAGGNAGSGLINDGLASGSSLPEGVCVSRGVCAGGGGGNGGTAGPGSNEFGLARLGAAEPENGLSGAGHKRR